jgi:twinkle protein
MPIIEPQNLLSKLMDIKRSGNIRKGVSTGFVSIDEYMLLSKQYLMIVTGVPSSGKSEVLDAIAVNTAVLHGWKWLYFSPENFPLEAHLQKFVEKKIGKHLTSATDHEIIEAVSWVNDHFSWVHPDETKYALHDILAEVQQRIEIGYTVDAIVIDPWNELNHSGQGSRDDLYIGQCLTTIRKFHRKYDLLTAIVIHPHSIPKDKNGNYPVPTLNDCNGGAVWRAKADFGICVNRPDYTKHQADVIMQKIKFKSMGRQGKVTLDYDVKSGRFKDQFNPEFNLPEKIDLPL